LIQNTKKSYRFKLGISKNYSAYILENHNDLLVIQYECNETDSESYGDYLTECAMYDTKQNMALYEGDALEPNYFDTLNSTAKQYYPWMFADDSPTITRSIEFGAVLQEGVLFLGPGNHGWIFNFCFFPFQDMKPVLKKDFVERYFR
jgi:hypothetical protein